MRVKPSMTKREIDLERGSFRFFFSKTRTSITTKKKRMPKVLGNFVNVATARKINDRRYRLNRLTSVVIMRNPTDTLAAVTESEPPVDGADQSIRFIAMMAQAGMSSDIENPDLRMRLEVSRIKDAASAVQ